MTILVDCDKLHIYDVRDIAILKQTMQRDVLKNIIEKLKWNSKKYSVNPQEGRKGKQRN